MAELIREHSATIQTVEGTQYRVFVWGAQRADGMWEGWLEFNPIDRRRSALRTQRETSQPNRAAIDYWASGLEPIYLEGAFARAQGRLP